MSETTSSPDSDHEDHTSDTKPKAHLNMLAQYAKEMSFSSPNAPKILQNPGTNPNMQISVNVNAQKIGDDIYEVTLDITARAKNDEGVIYNLELLYAGLFRLQNIPQKAIQAVLLIDCPGLLFPFVRRLAADLSREGGFPPLMLDPIDFAGLFRSKLQAQKEAANTQRVN